MATELKRLALDANSFLAMGKKYIVHPTIGIERYKKMEELQVIASFGADFKTLYAAANKAYGQLNAMKVGDAAVTLNGILEGLSRTLSGQETPLLLICTLFISEENEDLSSWDEAKAGEKIKDWTTDGYDAADFFKLAFDLLKQYHSNFQQDFLNTLEEIAQESNDPAQSL